MHVSDHDYPRTCRYCGARRWKYTMIKYGTRCYACCACYAEHHTLSEAAGLPESEREKLHLYRYAGEGTP